MATGFSATVFTLFVFRDYEIPTYIPTTDGSGSCTPGPGEYMGVEAACFGPIGLPPYLGYPPACAAPEGINFTLGPASPAGNGRQTGDFTATGELIGFTPTGCDGPVNCTELWDVTLTGQGTYMLIPNDSRTDFVAVDLHFEPPSSVPEPSTGLLMWGGILLGAGAMARNKSGAWLRDLLS